MKGFWREARKVVQTVMGPKHLPQTNYTGSTAAGVAESRHLRLIKIDIEQLHRTFQTGFDLSTSSGMELASAERGELRGEPCLRF